MATTRYQLMIDAAYLDKLQAEGEARGMLLQDYIRERLGAPPLKSGRPTISSTIKVRAMILGLQGLLEARAKGAPVPEGEAKHEGFWRRELQARNLFIDFESRFTLGGTPYADLQPPDPVVVSPSTRKDSRVKQAREKK